jgi:hypothetical protein
LTLQGLALERLFSKQDPIDLTCVIVTIKDLALKNGVSGLSFEGIPDRIVLLESAIVNEEEPVR